MRLRLCCGCVIDGKGRIGIISKQKGQAIELQTGPPLREQPKRGESIPLEKITTKKKSNLPKSDSKESSKLTKPSFITYVKEFATGQGHVNQAFSTSTEAIQNIIPKSRSLEPIILDPSKLTETKLPTLIVGGKKPIVIVSATSNFTYISKNGKQSQMTFEQIAPNHFRGMFKHIEFTLENGRLLSKDGAFNKKESDLILRNYRQGLLAMHQGVLGLEEKILNSLDLRLPTLNLSGLSELTIPDESNIKLNFTSDNGEKSIMSFKQIKPGIFQGTWNNKVFSIANGKVLTFKGPGPSLDKELILNWFYRAMMGMQQTKLGIQKGEWAEETILSGDQLNPMELLKAACPERRLLFEEESLRVHNEYRQIHGAPPLVHSNLLCEMAREWAEHLALKDTTYKRHHQYYGENLYHSNGVSLDARNIISVWYNEINLYDFTNPKFTNETEHFTQLVWKDTKEMGTGIAQMGDKIWVCCYYHPPGNDTSKPFEDFVLNPNETS